MANINVKFKVKNEHKDEFLLGFLASNPVPLDSGGSPLYDDEDWVEIYIKEHLHKEYSAGKYLIASDSAVVEEIIFEDIE